jgi:hypothetical protein
MANLPTGAVTFLFTDIETHNGYVFQIKGDAFCAAFHTAREASQCITMEEAVELELEGRSSSS